MGINKIKEYKHISIHSQCETEIKKLNKGYPYAKKFQEWLGTKLLCLDDLELQVLKDFPRQFEFIEKDLYAITYRHQQKNIRILFTVSKNGIKILMCAFNEGGMPDYDRAKKQAKLRMRDI